MMRDSMKSLVRLQISYTDRCMQHICVGDKIIAPDEKNIHKCGLQPISPVELGDKQM